MLVVNKDRPLDMTHQLTIVTETLWEIEVRLTSDDQGAHHFLPQLPKPTIVVRTVDQSVVLGLHQTSLHMVARAIRGLTDLPGLQCLQPERGSQ